jgi:hypothetical protein
MTDSTRPLNEDGNAVAARCVACGVNPRGAGGRLSRCLPCLCADVAAWREQRAVRKARAVNRHSQQQPLKQQEVIR